jgi:hypothetical protein
VNNRRDFLRHSAIAASALGLPFIVAQRAIAEEAPPLPSSSLVAVLGQMPGSTASRGEDVPPRTDFYGDPLPPGAIARMGTNRFADVIEGGAVLLSPDSAMIVLQPIWSDPLVHVCDATTGRVLYKLVDGETTKGREFKVFGFSPDNHLLALAPLLSREGAEVYDERELRL